jgi:cytochrome P450
MSNSESMPSILAKRILNALAALETIDDALDFASLYCHRHPEMAAVVEDLNETLMPLMEKAVIAARELKQHPDLQ